MGKTRAAAEFVRAEVRAGRVGRIHLIGKTPADARDVMVEGDSGILAISPPDERPLYEPSKRRLTWPNGARGLIFSSQEPGIIPRSAMII
jgi:phage terminase large subunit-like protein